jgi:hypothetical protein
MSVEQQQQVKVTTFKPASGKYYDEFTITIESQESWYFIIEAVRTYKLTAKVQSDMDWLIGMDDSREDMYPIILK